MPTFPQYARRKIHRISRKVATSVPCSPPVINSRSKSQIVKSKFSKSSSGDVMRSHIERINVGEQMPANAVSVDELQNLRLFFGLFAEMVAAEKRRIIIFRPAKRRIIDFQIVENLVVKIRAARLEIREFSPETNRFPRPE